MHRNILLSVMAVLAFCGCSEKEVPVESVTVEPATMTLEIGASGHLTASVSPANATIQDIEWTSQDTSIATVDGNGTVTAVAQGSTKIQAKCGIPAMKGFCKLTVVGKEVPPVEPGKSLSKAEAEQERQQVIADWKASEKSKVQKIDGQKYVTDEDGHIMKYAMYTYGQEPQGGHSLWISLHGGGGGDGQPGVNDQQWENQKTLYQYASPKQPEEGIYVAPRAYKDASDMWYFRGNDNLFRQIIETMVILYGVNPDKVYLLGYSAGGDGVWRMAPRIADHWAAASMMAGHPGNTRFENLRNLPFTMWVGGKDTDYDRNTKVPEASSKIDKLHDADPDGYIHDLHVLENMPHWMEYKDGAAFPWMAQYTRNPYPKKIVWRQENEEKKMPQAFFYWLKVADRHINARSDDDSPGASNERKAYLGKELTVEVKGNTIEISKCDYTTFTIYLNDQMVDLDKNVNVTFNGKSLFNGKVDRTVEVLRQSMAERNDPSYCFPAQIVVTVK